MKNKIIEKIEFFFVYLLYGLARIIPEKFFKLLLRKLLAFAFNILKKEKNIAFTNLQIIDPAYSLEEKKKIFKNFCLIYSEILFDQIRFSKFSKEDIRNKIKVTGLENIKNLIDKGKGIILVTAHLGNWEVFSSYASLNQVVINGLYRPLDNKLIDKYLANSRTKYGVKLISKFSSPLKIIRPLLNKEALGFVSDQNTIKNHVYIPFFGKIAAASKGFSFFHLKTDAPVIFVYSYIDENLNQYGIIEKEYNFENLYNNLSIDEKFFLHLFDSTFNEKDIDLYKERLNYFFKFFSIEDRFKKLENGQYDEELKKFEKNLKEYKDLDFNQKTFYITYFFHKSLEKVIKKYPENWLLIHPRFNKQPAGLPRIYNFNR